MLTEMAPLDIGQPLLDELAYHLKLPSSPDAETMAEVSAAFRAAVAHLETQLGLALIRRGFVWHGHLDGSEKVRPPINPVSEILSVQLYLPNGDTTPIDPALVGLDQTHLRTQLSSRANLSGRVEISFVAGFGPDWSAVPADLRHASFMLAAHYFDTRHDVGTSGQQTPHGVAALIAGWRPVRIGAGVAV